MTTSPSLRAAAGVDLPHTTFLPFGGDAERLRRTAAEVQPAAIIPETVQGEGGLQAELAAAAHETPFEVTVVGRGAMWLSPVSTHAEVVLPSQVAAPSPYDSLVPTLAVIETVVAGVLTALGENGHQRMRHGEDTARRMGLY